jgi:hypothetical protein
VKQLPSKYQFEIGEWRSVLVSWAKKCRDGEPIHLAMNRIHGVPTARRNAFLLAALSVALCVIGSGRAVVVFRHNAADSAEVARLFTWMGLPLALAVAGMLTTLSESVGPLWLSVGALFGFVVAAAWSLGLFYAYAALTLLAAAVVHLLTIRERWRLLLAPLWFLAGFGGLFTMFLIRHWAQESAYHHTVEASAVVWGGWLFAVVSGILAATYALAAFGRRSSRLRER